ncbi:hypothetical protein [Microvirga makkahensis]|uniref:DUF308 domain-containing protein n=1 Tax=Microvirga makkahensis TaxID=1128670 RepID=A0A7X3MWF4_9HYPH|nr:hypothetical protein [Microvirga makkahensis]MXQ14497.1 hypothetical protein [Microvirga makkahensis]
MIIALLALASAMIVGGLLAAFFGWDIVLIERGWTMVIAGSFSAGCGALLLGITAVVSKLARIQSELVRLQIGFDEAARDEASSSSTGLSTAALAGGLLGGGMLDRGEAKDQDVAQPDLPLFPQEDRFKSAVESRESGREEAEKLGERLLPFPPKTSSDETGRRDEDGEGEVKVPDFLLAERGGETYVETRRTPAEAALFGDEPRLDEPEEESRDEPVGDDLREASPEPATDHAPEPGSEPAAAREETAASDEESRGEAAEEAPRSAATIIGTYNSGDNTYVMFSDGSIEAQTPTGVFRFQSLDELKAFIASGGEGGGSPAT